MKKKHEFDDESETMKELRKIKEHISKETSGMSMEAEQEYFRKATEKFERETGITLPRLERTIR